MWKTGRFGTHDRYYAIPGKVIRRNAKLKLWSENENWNYGRNRNE